MLCGSNVPPSKLAIEPDVHDAAGTQQGSKYAPAGQWIIKMVQHADALDEIEALADQSQLQNVSLCVFDVNEAELSRLSLCVGEARATKIDGQNLRRWKSLRRLNRLLSGTATRDEHIDI